MNHSPVRCTRAFRAVVMSLHMVASAVMVRAEPLLEESFVGESFASLPSGPWATTECGDPATWQLDSAGRIACAQNDMSSTNTDVWLISPTVDCSGYSHVELSFRDCIRGGSPVAGYWTRAIVMGSTDGGTTWSAYSNTVHELPTNLSYQTIGPANRTLDMSWADGEPNVRFTWRFQCKRYFMEWWVVDDVVVSGAGGSSTNGAPYVHAGHPAEITLPDSVVSLDGTVTDDGVPAIPGAIALQWSKVSGPGAVAFADASAVDTTATITEGGTYRLRLSASDGEFSNYAEVEVLVHPPALGNGLGGLLLQQPRPHGPRAVARRRQSGHGLGAGVA